MAYKPVRKVALFGERAASVRDFVRSSFPGIVFSESKPDAVIPFGGDGTILRSEQKYPGVPKIPLRDAAGCMHCKKNQGKSHTMRGSGRWYCRACFSKIIARAANGDYRIDEELKLSGKDIGGKELSLEGLNEVQMHNADPATAVRFDIYLGRKKLFAGCIADGFIASTPYGSTGYFKSVTGKSFSKGIGLACINPTETKKPAVVAPIPGRLFVRGKIIRGKALLIADNNPRRISLSEGRWFTVKISRSVARFII